MNKQQIKPKNHCNPFPTHKKYDLEVKLLAKDQASISCSVIMRPIQILEQQLQEGKNRKLELLHQEVRNLIQGL